MLLALLSAATPAGAQTATEQQADVADEHARVAGEVGTLEAAVARLRADVAALAAEVAVTREEVAVAGAAAEAAEVRHRTARRAMAALTTEAVRLRATITSLAVEAYVQPDAADLPPLLWLAPVDAGRADVLTSTVAERLDDAVDDLATRAEQLERVRAEAQRASATAAAAGVRVVRAGAALDAALAAQQVLLAEVEADLEQTLAEAAALAQLDAALAARVAADGQVLAEAALAGSSGVTSGRGAPLAPVGVELRTVGGITVASSVADQLARLLAAAAAAGFDLHGGGFRDPAQQLALRAAHCGPSPEAVYGMPASRCSPPTARPGMSLHERGLAVDFAWKGTTITTESNEAFRWLAANAGRFGFSNLPGEPWHWSTTGG